MHPAAGPLGSLSTSHDALSTSSLTYWWEVISDMLAEEREKKRERKRTTVDMIRSWQTTEVKILAAHISPRIWGVYAAFEYNESGSISLYFQRNFHTG